VEGMPVQVLEHGRPIPSGLRSERLNRKEIEALLRVHGIGPERWSEVRAGYVENQGPLSVLQEHWARPADRSDLRHLRGERQ
jgi:uncharacterized membrane protein YcaP (DUF421 family)